MKKDNSLTVSIIMNCRNGDKFLKESLNSIIDQTYKNWELVFVDNMSTDNSKEIFHQYEDKRFKYLNKNLSLINFFLPLLPFFSLYLHL